MALTDEGNSNGFYMPVAPAYGGGYGGQSGFGGFGGDWGWIVLLLLLAGNGGWGMGGGFGGFGGNMALGYDFPWLMNGQQNIMSNTNNGFRDQMINDNVTSIRDGVSALSTQLCGCCGDIQQSLCNGFAGVNATVNSGFANAETAANARQIANMQQAFASQTAITGGLTDLSRQFADCCCENRLATEGLKYTIASEECATRANSTQNTQGILNAINGGIQSIKDQLCQDKIDAKNDEISQLRQEVLYARGQASQVAQNSAIINGVYNRLNECPVGTVPVYGEQPIFTCPNNRGCGCGCGNGSF